MDRRILECAGSRLTPCTVGTYASSQSEAHKHSGKHRRKSPKKKMAAAPPLHARALAPPERWHHEPFRLSKTARKSKGSRAPWQALYKKNTYPQQGDLTFKPSFVFSDPSANWFIREKSGHVSNPQIACYFI